MPVANATENTEAPVLPPRRETFLALYPRKLKLVVAAFLVVILVVPWFFLGGRPTVQNTVIVKHEAKIRSADKLIPADRAASSQTQRAVNSESGTGAVLNEQDSREYTAKMVT